MLLIPTRGVKSCRGPWAGSKNLYPVLTQR